MVLALIEIGIFLPIIKNGQLPDFINNPVFYFVFVMANLLVLFVMLFKS
jgi:hypothetical protein